MLFKDISSCAGASLPCTPYITQWKYACLAYPRVSPTTTPVAGGLHTYVVYISNTYLAPPSAPRSSPCSGQSKATATSLIATSMTPTATTAALVANEIQMTESENKRKNERLCCSVAQGKESWEFLKQRSRELNSIYSPFHFGRTKVCNYTLCV